MPESLRMPARVRPAPRQQRQQISSGSFWRSGRFLGSRWLRRRSFARCFRRGLGFGGRSFRFRIATSTLRSVDHRGGLDAYLVKARDEDLSPSALKVKKEIAKAQASA